MMHTLNMALEVLFTGAFMFRLMIYFIVLFSVSLNLMAKCQENPKEKDWIVELPGTLR